MATDGRVLPDDHEANVIAVVSAYAAEWLQEPRIAQFLRGVGVTSWRGAPICASRVFEMIHGGRSKARSIPGARASAALGPLR